jgi:hypothetical protein
LKLDLDPNDVQQPHGETKSQTWTRLHSLSKTSSISNSLVEQLQGFLKSATTKPVKNVGGLLHYLLALSHLLVEFIFLN